MSKLPDLCEFWDLAIPTCSPPSKLFSLQPLGMNTPKVESLTSYMVRLAEAHSVSLNTLMKKELLPLLKRDYLSNSSLNCLDSFWVEAARALNSTGILAQDWVHTLERLTLRTDLHFLTMLPWATVLTQQKLLKFSRSYCPDCLNEWQTNGQPIYEPLIWHVNIVSVCLRHQRALLEQCPYPDCGATLPVLAPHLLPGFCSKCSRWLGITSNPPDTFWTPEQWQWKTWITETIGELLSHNSNLKIEPHLENMPNLIFAAREQMADGSMKKLGEKLQISRRTLNVWLSGKQIPQLESILRVCYCCGISPFLAFTSQPGTLSLDTLKTQSLPDIPRLTGNRRQRIPMDITFIQQSLENVLANKEQPPPSMRTVAKRLNHSPRELRERFPNLCQTISDNRKDYYRIRREQKTLQLKKKIRQAMLTIHSQGQYPSSSRVRLLLNDPLIMRDRLAAKLWRDMLDELKLTGKIKE